ncbi:hypothetical protein PILCRDRAFT_86846 [Piloderma croceum F 1598]|uniref:Uncharacterized protein n=1 Tax=Piloderma croceum (strain F 1598) TaxID=765440 RepID=A0A0C3G4V5_PILCF|nr:hypothetical protein PILCRDRAFT_86846 [Piloderma croceum F 1598]
MAVYRLLFSPCMLSLHHHRQSHHVIVGIHLHFHDGELAKFGASLVDGVLAAMQCIFSKVISKGGYEKYEHRYHQAVKNMALMKKYLTPDQAAEIRTSVMERQATLNNKHESLSKKEQLVVYKEAMDDFAELIKTTLNVVIGDLGFNGGDADAYHMALACTSADLDAVQMMNKVMGLFNSVAASGIPVNPPNAPQPLKAPQPSKEPKVPKCMKEPKHTLSKAIDDLVNCRTLCRIFVNHG